MQSINSQYLYLFLFLLNIHYLILVGFWTTIMIWDPSKAVYSVVWVEGGIQLGVDKQSTALCMIYFRTN